MWDTAVMPPGIRRAVATARAVGEKVSIFTEDSLWDTRVTRQDVDCLFRLFTERGSPGSADPSKSIFEVTTDYFGAPPTAPNGSDHTVLLLADLPRFRNTVLDGYVNSFDQVTDEEARREGQRSNEANVLYLNGSCPTGVSSDYMQAVASHEFQHLTHLAHDPAEESWLNEMASQASMLANGYHTDMGHVARFASRPDRSLVSLDFVDYGAELLFAEFLMERYGRGFFQDLVASPRHGVESLDETLAGLGRSERFGDVYRDWIVANFADSQGAAEPGTHYARLDLPPLAESARIEGTGRAMGTVQPTGARYVRIVADGPTDLTLEGGPDLVAVAMRLEGRRLEKRELAAGRHDLAPGQWVVALGNLGAEASPYKLEARPAT